MSANDINTPAADAANAGTASTDAANAGVRFQALRIQERRIPTHVNSGLAAHFDRSPWLLYVLPLLSKTDMSMLLTRFQTGHPQEALRV